MSNATERAGLVRRMKQRDSLTLEFPDGQKAIIQSLGVRTARLRLIFPSYVKIYPTPTDIDECADDPP